jgi:DNA-binding transcriptional MerR regulator/methylmalonyl-CoA mutase cobalamin-binding subunit
MKTVVRRQHDVYPLRTVAGMTGLTPDVIRAWEKRYGVVSPIRGDRGARLYSSADIGHLRLLARVVGAGRAIGDVAALERAELERLAAQPAPELSAGAREPQRQAKSEVSVADILERLRSFDHSAVRTLLGDALIGLGARRFVYEVALPLVRDVGMRWRAKDLTIAEEHLLSAMLRNVLAGLIESRRATGPSILLATPAGERHDIGLLLVAILALDAGASVVYLGADLPAGEIAAAAKRACVHVVGISVVTSKNRARASGELAAIQAALPGDCELWVGGAEAANVIAGARAFRGLVVESLAEAESELARVANMAPRRARR